MTADLEKETGKKGPCFPENSEDFRSAKNNVAIVASTARTPHEMCFQCGADFFSKLVAHCCTACNCKFLARDVDDARKMV